MTDAKPAHDTFASFVSTAMKTLLGLSLRTKLIGTGIALALLLTFALSSVGGRTVTINGYQLNDEQLTYLDNIAGAQVPDGNYWLDPQTMAWGIVGDPQPRGVLGVGGQQASRQAPHWGDEGQNYRGPFGDYMSDGKCSAVNGIMVGDC